MEFDSFASCDHCGKFLFESRKAARARARAVHPDKKLNAYYCEIGRGWHYGSLPAGGREQARDIQLMRQRQAQAFRKGQR